VYVQDVFPPRCAYYYSSYCIARRWCVTMFSHIHLVFCGCHSSFLQGAGTSGRRHLPILTRRAFLTSHRCLTADLLHCVMYPGHPLPSFVLPPEALKQLMLLHGSCRKPHGVGKEMLSHILNHIKQGVYFCCHLPQRYFLRWTKLPHTSLLLGKVADLTEGKSDFSMDVPSGMPLRGREEDESALFVH
jgi:hypothetical protein